MEQRQPDNDWTHSHVFNEGNPLAKKNTTRAVILTAVMPVVEIVGGYTFNSMALLADGWPMSFHELALGLSVVGYVFRSDERRVGQGMVVSCHTRWVEGNE